MDLKPVDIRVKTGMMIVVMVLMFLYSWRNKMNADIERAYSWKDRDDPFDFDSSSFYILRILLKIIIWIIVFVIIFNVVFNVFAKNFISFLKVNSDAEKDMSLNFVFSTILTTNVILVLLISGIVSGIISKIYINNMILPEDSASVGRIYGHLRSIYIFSFITFAICISMLTYFGSYKKL